MGDQETGRGAAGAGSGHTHEGRRQGPGTERAVSMLTAGETAALLGVSTMTVYRLIRRGTLTALRVGSVYRIPERAARSYLGELRTSREALRRGSRP